MAEQKTLSPEVLASIENKKSLTEQFSEDQTLLQSEITAQPFSPYPRTNNFFQRGLNYLFGFSPFLNKWFRIKAQVDGRLRVQTYPRTSDTGTSAPITLTTSVLVIIPDVAGTITKGIVNISTQTVYLGFNAIFTSANGFPLLVNQSITFDNHTGKVWGIVPSGTAEVRYFQLFATAGTENAE